MSTSECSVADHASTSMPHVLYYAIVKKVCRDTHFCTLEEENTMTIACFLCDAYYVLHGLFACEAALWKTQRVLELPRLWQCCGRGW